MRSTRCCAAVLVGLMAALSFGQSLGTKPDVTTKQTVAEQPLVQPMDMVQMFVALLIVGALLKWVLPKVIAKFGKRLSSPIGSTIEVQESSSFGAGQLQIVKVRDRTLLLCVTAQAVSCLADLTEPVNTPQTAKDAFIDFLDNANPANAVVSEASDDDTANDSDDGMSMDDAMKLIAQAQAKLLGTPQESSPLERLNRLTGSQ